MTYFDNAATTFPKPEVVYEFTNKFFRECGVNVGRGQHKLSSKASQLVEETRNLLLDLFKCPNKEIVFTHTATEALNIIIRGINLTKNSTVYISPFEHNAVTRVLTYLQSKYSINIVELEVDKNSMTYNLQEIQKQFIEQKPSAVIVSHASNVCGVIAPINKICELAKQHNSVTIIDMCQTAGLIDTNLSNLNIDFAVFAGHKTLYAPMGIAGFITSNVIKASPLIYGGTGIDSANQNLPSTTPEMYEVASQNIMAISGLNSALKWIKETTIDSIRKKEQENLNRLISILESYENITLKGYMSENETVGVISCTFDSYTADEIGKVLSNNDIAVRTGLHCSPYAHKFLGTFPEGTVRFSVSYFNTLEDFDKLEEVLDLIAGF